MDDRVSQCLARSDHAWNLDTVVFERPTSFSENQGRNRNPDLRVAFALAVLGVPLLCVSQNVQVDLTVDCAIVRVGVYVLWVVVVEDEVARLEAVGAVAQNTGALWLV